MRWARRAPVRLADDAALDVGARSRSGSHYAVRRMKRKPQLTKREKKALAPPRPAQPQGGHNHEHIHCIACGRHLDAGEFEAPATATTILCDHGSRFPSCTKCVTKSLALLKEHDASNQPVRTATPWH